MATFEYGQIQLGASDGTPMVVQGMAGIPAADGSVEGLNAIEALNRLGARGWRPVQVQDLTKVISDLTSAEVWHVVRSSDDKPSDPVKPGFAFT
ncbi:hypothetical protein [Myceligenerans indicum]|uniref:2-nitropropane dioxygenase n=1 Tax=Myceligenerans indicum TaxID=2593663 RepID=A0ABS1LIM1_9MICO|nr:hypothetical protein [Myceligenerans indicum]MBL0886036.1 hypothetical protein [Myceligenerans indicum]